MRKTLLIGPLLALTAAQTPSRAPIEGLWKNPVGSAIIAITPCASALCGKVVWASARGQREVAKTTSNVVGTTVLTDLFPKGSRWTGSLFIPDDNIHVSAKLQLVGNRQLKLTGCAFAGLFCRTQIWSRFEGPLPTD
jgi:uncharacterized protein (DUF2147 family)